MKKLKIFSIVIVVIILFTVISIFGYNILKENIKKQVLSTIAPLEDKKETTNQTTSNTYNKENNKKSNNISNSIKDNKIETKEATVDIEKLKNEQLLTCTSAKVTILNKAVHGIYSDVLQADVINNSTEIVKSYRIIFLGYDENYLPVKVEPGGIRFDKADYFYSCLHSEANIMPGEKSKEDVCWELSNTHQVRYTIACVKDAEFYNGEKWENPYIKYWLEKYKGKILPEDSREGLVKYGDSII